MNKTVEVSYLAEVGFLSSGLVFDKCFSSSISVDLTIALKVEAHFTDEETEVPKGHMTSPRPQS